MTCTLYTIQDQKKLVFVNITLLGKTIWLLELSHIEL